MMGTQVLLGEGAWSTHDTTHARGQAYDGEGRLLRADALAERFAALISTEEWSALAASLNGCFAAVAADAHGARAAVDRLRSIPLFYTQMHDGVAIADSARTLLDQMPGLRIDPVGAAEFRLTGYTTADRTLYEGLKQIPAGHVLSAHAAPARCELNRYYAYRHADFVDAGEAALVDQLAALHERVFRRLLDDTGGRPLAIPLSGGYDSRLIGVMLRDLGCRNVLCYTYGTEGNWEARISRELAGYLGFRWTMVPYSAQRWRGWRDLPAFQHYFRESGNACASPHFQDWPAVHELSLQGQLAPDAVFVPGHSGDFLAGSHVPAAFMKRAQLSREDVLQALFDVHYTLWDWPPDPGDTLRAALIDRIERVTGPIRAGTPEQAADVFEAWDCAERQAKFIVNAVRVYESFGYEWRLPLFDHELMDFWSRIPLERRNGRALYKAFVRQRQSLPITQANTDRAAPIAAALTLIQRAGLKPLAKRGQWLLRRACWRREYEGDTLAWFAIVEPNEFRRRYTGREIGHSFFAARYLDSLDG